MPNRLSTSTSPYLLQHQDNPVDWYPWGEEALALAKQFDRPIFLSIGYSACHWCHVMAHESFEDPNIAQLINESFIAIKVDREQRPDLDHIYMQAVQLLTGSGGWPMSVFLTPEGNPFFGGTYWPPYAKWGRPGFDQVLKAVADAWREKRDQIEQQGVDLAKHIQESYSSNPPASTLPPLSIDDLWLATSRLEEHFDPSFGGFGQAPKFPHTMDLNLLMRMYSRHRTPEKETVIRHTLDCMARGGIYDHLGGGFSRYSVDEYWLVPHFEKMLYDNALLITCYLDGYRIWNEPFYLQVAIESCEYLLRDLRHPDGGFYSAEDADSEGEEGKFYVWSMREAKDILRSSAFGPPLSEEETQLFLEVYGLTEAGNFEGHNILNLLGPPRARQSRLETIADSRGMAAKELFEQLLPARRKLLDCRSQRIRPGLDDKILVAWNALAIDSLAQAGMVTQRDDLLQAAIQAATFILKHLRPNGRLLHVWRQGVAEIPAFLDDYAYLIHALLTLHQATQSTDWIELAESLSNEMLEAFSDPESGGFMYVAKDAERLIAKTRDDVDHSIPSGSGMAATALARLGALTGSQVWTERAWKTVDASRALLQRAPGATGQLWIALDWLIGPNHEHVVVLPATAPIGSPEVQSYLKTFWERFAPRDLLWLLYEPTMKSSALARPVLEGKTTLNEQPTLYLCTEGKCLPPVLGLQNILQHFQQKPS